MRLKQLGPMAIIQVASLEITIMRHDFTTKIHKTRVDPVAESSRKFS